MTIEPSKTYTVTKGTPLVEAGTKVKAPNEKDFVKSRGAINPDAIQCVMPNGGALFFTADQLS